MQKKSKAPINHDDADHADEDTDDDAEDDVEDDAENDAENDADDDAEDDAGHDQEIGGKRIMTSVSPTSLPNPNSLNYKTKDPDKCKTMIGIKCFCCQERIQIFRLAIFQAPRIRTAKSALIAEKKIISDFKSQAFLLFHKRRIGANTDNV